MAKKNNPIVEEVNIPEVEETVVEEPVVEEKKYLTVTANSLNVRRGPSKDTEVLIIVKKDEKLLMNEAKPIDGFYSVTTPTSINGYVMKEFVVKE